MRRIILFLMIVITDFSCQERKTAKENMMKELNIVDIKISCPSDLTYVKTKGTDSYTAYLFNQKKDTFEIEYGERGIINSLYYLPPSVFPFSTLQRMTDFYGRKPTSEEALFSDYPKEDNELRIFAKNYFMYDTVNGIIMKIEQPKRIGDGITGVYIPMLRDGQSFSMYAKNLDSTSHINAIKMFHSIRYK